MITVEGGAPGAFRQVVTAEAARILGVPDGDVDGALAAFDSAASFDRRFRTNPAAGTWLSAAAALRPGGERLAERLRDAVCRRVLVDRLYGKYGPAATHLEVDLRALVTVVPWPADTMVFESLARLYFGDQLTSSQMNVLRSVHGLVATVTVDGNTFDGVAAAALVRGPGGDRIACGLVSAGVLGPNTDALARGEGARLRSGVSAAPVKNLAKLPEPMGACLEHAPLPRPLASWTTFRPVYRHLQRMGDVLDMQHPPSVLPDRLSVSSIHIGAEDAATYDQRLLDDAVAAADGTGEPLDRCERNVMRGFTLFRNLLAAAAALGARVDALPNGIGLGGHRPAYLLAEDRAPVPDVYIELLVLLPELVGDGPFATQLKLHHVCFLREHVSLALDQRCWVPEPPHVVLHLPWEANKHGTGAALLAAPWIEYLALDTSDLPARVSPNPPNWLRAEFDKALDDLYGRFKARTGLDVPGDRSSLARTAMARLVHDRGRHLPHVDDHVQALLGQLLDTTRNHYLAPTADQLRSRLAAVSLWRGIDG